MGNDIDISSKDKQMDELFAEASTNETTPQFIRKYFDKFCDSISNPERSKYEFEDLAVADFDNMEFNIFSMNTSLHCCHWAKRDFKMRYRRSTQSSDSLSPPICIVYLHTNTRSLLDALEVIPLARMINAHVIAMDLPGCGQSDGKLKGNVEQELLHLLEWASCLISRDTQFILWARGMSTALAIDLMKIASTQPAKSRELGNVKCAILDSPFIGVEKMLTDLLAAIERQGHHIPRSLTQICVKLGLKALSRRLDGLNLFSITPLKSVPDCNLPCFVLAADNDDYIPVGHGIAITAKWGHNQKQFSVFTGQHFGVRPVDVVCSQDMLNFLERCVEIERTSLKDVLENQCVREVNSDCMNKSSTFTAFEDNGSNCNADFKEVTSNSLETPSRLLSPGQTLFSKVVSPMVITKSLSMLPKKFPSMLGSGTDSISCDVGDASFSCDNEVFQTMLEKELAGEDLVLGTL